MGTKIPPPDEPPPETGYACSTLSQDPMPNAIVTITGVVVADPATQWNPNGIHTLTPVASCSWMKSIMLPGGYEIRFNFGVGGSFSEMICYQVSPYTEMYFYRVFTFAPDGKSELTGLWSGGEHQVVFRFGTGLYGLSGLAESIGMSPIAKNFYEPAGQNIDGGTVNRRLASHYDGTCVYIKQPID